MKAEITDHKGDKVVNVITVGISWVDMRLILFESKKNSLYWVGVCHFTDKVYMWTPLDFEKPLLVTSIQVSPTENYCEKAFECVNFDCKLNKFKKDVFIAVFKDLGRETLGLPQNFGPETSLWFNDKSSQWHTFWGKFLTYFKMKPEGGKLGFSRKALDMWHSNKTQLVKEVTDPQLVKKIQEDNKKLSRKSEWKEETV